MSQSYVSLQGGGGVLLVVLCNACIYFTRLFYPVDLSLYKMGTGISTLENYQKRCRLLYSSYLLYYQLSDRGATCVLA